MEKYLDFQPDLYRENYPYENVPSREFRRRDLMTELSDHSLYMTLLAIENDAIIGRGIIVQRSVDSNRDTVFLTLDVLSAFRGQGIGSQLFAKMGEICRGRGVSRFKTSVREYPGYQKIFQFAEIWLSRLNAHETHVDIKSRLLYKDIDQEFLQEWKLDLEESLGYLRIEFMSKEVYCNRVLSDDVFANSMLDYFNEVESLIPRGEGVSPDPPSALHQFREETQGRLDSMWSNLTIFAWDGNTVVGSSQIYFPQEGHHVQLSTGLTGVRKLYWGRSIATYLKISILLKMYSEGFDFLDTENSVNNTAMLHINWKLGIKRIYLWHEYEGRFPQ